MLNANEARINPWQIFIESINGFELENSDRKRVKIKLRNRPSTNSDEIFWILEFEGFPGELGYFPRAELPENFVEFSINESQKILKINFVKLTDPQLKGKNVYPQILGLIGNNFPTDYKLTSDIEHPATKDEILSAYISYNHGEISEIQMQQKIANSNLIAKTIQAGFNIINIVIDSDTAIHQTAWKQEGEPVKIIIT